MSRSDCLCCAIGWHHRCKKAAPANDEGGLFVCCCEQEDTPSIFTPTRLGTRTLKDATLVKDVTSTGRKRAVKIKVIDKENPQTCEWAYLDKAGGGVEPIIGCTGNVQVNVHHGPDKDTLNNDELNLHAICSHCHNRWHTANDKYYAEQRPPAGESYLPVGRECIPHDPSTKVKLADLIKIEGERALKK